MKNYVKIKILKLNEFSKIFLKLIRLLRDADSPRHLTLLK